MTASRLSLTLSAATLALAAAGATAQEGSTDPAQIAEETRRVLEQSGGEPATPQGEAGAAATEAPAPQGEAGASGTAQTQTQPAQPQPGQGDPAQPQPTMPPASSNAQPETLRMLGQPAPEAAPVENGAISLPGAGQASDGAPTPNEIEAATYQGGPLPEGQSALTAKLQILLDRAHVSPGVIDGWKGGMSQSAIAAFETREGLAVDGELDPEVWQALGGTATGPVLSAYTITAEDVSGLNPPLPEDYAKLAEMQRLGYASTAEKLAERFHMDEGFLKELNPGATWAEGESITVADPGPRAETRVARIEVRKQSNRLAGFDAEGRMVVNYPVTIGSDQTPSPSGTVEVVAVAMEPTYTYRPDVNFQQGDNDETLILPPGPNGPVGSVWIDLSQETYGLHGTSDPDSIFDAASHGCVRLTNWDVEELAHLVSEGVTVEFVE
ncbi:L,D-transpeptidase family protein [Limimaricola pyoseonensis]|uniref:Lipoprotein-anchoring transpeptidase ErfK/SrfK n=1 Tax=Limimaricola pyoseonensis TaxID=521013 RepID=A0A1G7GZQ7_9RHOB|nr:L,D-transpeptidase [Limimaricola pyoseonensis]SDE93419.1 Lipoprotein-anchoring transpeptidase ErfK/SrfK [Limimaricola pyoseonensis]